MITDEYDPKPFERRYKKRKTGHICRCFHSQCPHHSGHHFIPASGIVGISIIVYFAIALVFPAAMPNAELAANYGAMKSISKYGFLIDTGVVAATLSSAMASFLGAPRILQSLSADRVVSMFFLISYGLLNYATFFEAKAASPSFRPPV